MPPFGVGRPNYIYLLMKRSICLRMIELIYLYFSLPEILLILCANEIMCGKVFFNSKNSFNGIKNKD